MTPTKTSTSRPSNSRYLDILPMSVDNMTFLIDRLAQDCAPLQFMRELTVNSIQAVALTEEQNGTIIWDVDWFYHELTGVFKLCCIDTGIGMTGQEMVDTSTNYHLRFTSRQPQRTSALARRFLQLRAIAMD